MQTGQPKPGGDTHVPNRAPLGFGMALAQNEGAMARFEQLSQAEKDAMIEKCHQVNSKREMQNLVNSLLS